MTEDMEIIQGAVSAVVYQNYENGYAVLRLNVGGGQNITVVGTIPLPTVGERLMVTGKWSSHPSYGRQFEAEFLERLLPQTAMEILSYLSSRVIKGIGPKMAGRIVEQFGDQTLAIMEREPEQLAQVPGISRDRARAIGEEFRLQVGMRQLMEFFALHHLPAELAVRCYKLYGESTIELLYDDPYLLMDDGLDAPFEAVDRFAIELGIAGDDPRRVEAGILFELHYNLTGGYLLMDDGLDAPFEAVDRFAIELGIAGDDPRRVEAGILFELHYNLTGGHSFLPQDKLTAATAQLLSVDSAAVGQGIDRLLECDRLVRQHLAGITVIYLPELYEAERYCAEALLAFAESRFPEPAGLNQKIRRIAKESQMEYSQQQTQAIRESATCGLRIAKESQMEYSQQQTQAIRESATCGLLLITGGPGTGKTTILNGILSLLGQMQLRCLLAAPTGRAAKRLTEVTGEDASTIHRLLEASIDPATGDMAAKRLTEVTGEDASTIHRLLEASIDPATGDMVFLRDAANPLKGDVIIVDEMSMVDVQLLYALLQAVPRNKRLILVGDPDQLPPVGPGFPFRDMLRSGVLPAVQLTEIFRQAQQSLIVMNAHRVDPDQLPPVGPGFPFRDMLRSGVLPAVQLTEIFRQAQQSLIVMNAHRVNQGQLPPVGPGFPFRDMLRSGVLPAVQLTEIFRQAQQSLIVMNAHRVNQGQFPELRTVTNDFFFMRRNSEEGVSTLIRDLCTTRLPKNMGIPPEQIQVLCPTRKGGVGTVSLNKLLQASLNPLIRDLCTTRLPKNMGIPPEQIQVLCPTRKGGVGTVSLNKLLQASLNPPSPEKKERTFGEYLFREGDRVMQIRNNYDILWKKCDGSAAGAGIFNGDVGTIQQIDPQTETLSVVFDDREAVYDFTQLNELEPNRSSDRNLKRGL